MQRIVLIGCLMIIGLLPLACGTGTSSSTSDLDATVQAAIAETRTVDAAVATSIAATATANAASGSAETPEPAPSATAEPQVTNTPPLLTPTSPPTSAQTATPTLPPAPTQTPTEEKLLVAESDVDGDDGNDFLRSNSQSNQGRVVLLPGFAQSDVTDPMVFRERMVFRVEIFDTRAGLVDGDGVQDVTFRIEVDDGSGQVVYERKEQHPAFCVFGGGEPDCNVIPLGDGSRWPGPHDGKIRNGDYLAKIDIVPADGEATQWRWRFSVEMPGQTDYVPANTARINGISVQDGRYVVDFETFDFKPQLPGQHVHFFFNTVPLDQAGVPGSGPWQIYPTGPGQLNTSPFTLYTVDQRPAGATQMCILIANPDHSVTQGTGNCVDLP
jgi:hypothetical protein